MARPSGGKKTAFFLKKHPAPRQSAGETPPATEYVRWLPRTAPAESLSARADGARPKEAVGLRCFGHRGSLPDKAYPIAHNARQRRMGGFIVADENKATENEKELTPWRKRAGIDEERWTLIRTSAAWRWVSRRARCYFSQGRRLDASLTLHLALAIANFCRTTLTSRCAEACGARDRDDHRALVVMLGWGVYLFATREPPCLPQP
jgi:hypothetical protein